MTKSPERAYRELMEVRRKRLERDGMLSKQLDTYFTKETMRLWEEMTKVEKDRVRADLRHDYEKVMKKALS